MPTETQAAEQSAGAATVAANREAVAHQISDVAAIARYRDQLTQYREQEAKYREQAAESERQAAAYKVQQQQYAAQLAALRNKPANTPRAASAKPADDKVTCRDVKQLGSFVPHRECRTGKQWKALD